MNNTLHLTKRNIKISQPVGSLRFITRLIQAIAKLLFAHRDDPAALRYITNKYDGKID